MQNRMGWVMATLAVACLVAALGVALNGWRTTPPVDAPPVSSATGNPQDVDPLAPRLFDQSGPIRIHVAGAVRKPGVYSIPAWSRVFDAMKKAGGASADADLDGINLADTVRDGEQLRIPVKGRREELTAHRPTPEPPPVSRRVGGRATGRYPFRQAAATRTAPPAATAEGSAPESSGPVNLNTASQQELEALPGIGPATAKKILAYRQEQGLFLQPEDLMNVKGIGPKKFDRLRPLILVR